MGSRGGEDTSVEKCLASIRETQKKAQDVPFSENYLGIQQSLHELRALDQQIADLKKEADDLGKSQGRTEETEHLIFQHQILDKKRCLETSLYVSDIENTFQNVETQIADRASYLITREKVFESVYRGQDIEDASQLHRDAINAIRNTWSWIEQVSTCLETHVQNAADYHQFFHSVRTLHEDMTGFMAWLGCARVRRKTETRDPDAMLQHVRLITTCLLDYQARVERLLKQSRDIYPIHYRIDPLPYPLKARSLLCYRHQNLLTVKDEVCTLMDNSDPHKWKIVSSRGEEGEIPAILLVILPPDQRAYTDVHRLREQLLVHWQTAICTLRSHLMAFLTKTSQEAHLRQLQKFTASQKTQTMRLLNESAHLFRCAPTNEKYQEFLRQITGVRKALSQAAAVSSGKGEPESEASQTWYKAEKAIRCYKDLLAYSRLYTDASSLTTETENLLILESDVPLVYTSKAYFERAMPVEIDEKTKETTTHSVTAEIYIHERFPGGDRARASKQKSQLRAMALAGNGVGSGGVASGQQRTKAVVLTGVLDPRTRQRISVLKALSTGVVNQVRGTYNNPDDASGSISIPEAICQGLVAVDHFGNLSDGAAASSQNRITNGGWDHDEHVPRASRIDTTISPVAGVLDPHSGNIVGITEAINGGIIKLKTGKYINPVTGEEMSILEGIQNGYIVVDPDVIENSKRESVRTWLELEDARYVVSTVTDPSTGAEISLKLAISDGIIDTANGMYRNPLTGHTMIISEAIRQGLVLGRPYDPLMDKESRDVLTIKELQVKQEKYVPSDSETTSPNGDIMDGLKLDTNLVMYDKISQKLDTNLRGIKDPTTAADLTILDAFQKGILHFDTAEYDHLDGEISPLPVASVKGLVQPNVLKEILTVYNESSVGELIDRGVFDSDTGLITDLKNDQTLSLHAAVSREIVNPETTFFYEVPTHKIMSLSSAIENGRYDVDTGRYVKTDNQEELSFTEAERNGLIKTHINPEKISEQSETLSHLRGLVSVDVKGVKVPQTGQVISIGDAIRSGVLNIPQAAYVDEKEHTHQSLISAVKTKKINSEAAMELFCAMDKLSLQATMVAKQINPNTGKLTTAAGSKPITIKDAADKSIINPDYIFFVDHESGDISTLGSHAAKGIFDPRTGTFQHPKSGKPLSIAAAIEEGLINPRISPERYVEVSSTLKELIDDKKVNPRNTTFMIPNGQSMSLREAMANGFLTMNSKVKVDPNTGNVHLASDEEVVKVLVQVKEKADWLAEVEKLLVTQQKPSEKLDSLKDQHRDHTKIHKDIQGQQPVVRSTIAHAQEILETEKKAKKFDGNPQYQKLRYNTSDLKVRFDAASNEAETRTRRFDDLYEDLENFYSTVDGLDRWMDSAIEKAHEIQRSRDDPEVQYKLFKEFLEDFKTKEEKICQLVELGDKFRDDTQEFMNGVEKYRRHVHIMPTIKEETEESAMIDEELESLEAKYKDISRECVKYMEQLTSLVKQKKDFTDLNNKLIAVYPGLESKLKSVDVESVTKNPEEVTSCLNSMKHLKADLIGQGKRLRDLHQVGEKLVQGLTHMNMKEDANKILNTILDRENTNVALHKNIDDIEEVLTAALSASKSIINRLENMLSWVEDADESVSKNEPISLMKDKLESQLVSQRQLNAEISSNKSMVEKLAQECTEVAGAEAKLAEVDDKIDELEKKSYSRTQKLEDTVAKISSFEDHVGEISSWLNDSIVTLKSRPNSVMPHVFKARVDSLYNEKKDKEANMEDIRQLVKEIMRNNKICDDYTLKGSLADVQDRWHELTELLVQEISLEALTEIDGLLKYLDKAENDINTAEPISIDQEIVQVQLREHNEFHDDLNQKKNSVKDVISKCNRMLRETTNSQTEAIKSRLDSIRTQADIVCQLSADRLHQLEAALPLAAHFSENQVEIQAWLDEIEAELKAQQLTGDNLDQVKKHQDSLKVTQQIIEDHKPFVEDLKATGMELMDLCGDNDATDLHNCLYKINSRYDALRSDAREKVQKLNDTRNMMTQEVSDTLENLLEDLSELKRNVLNCDPVSASLEKLQNEVDENRVIKEDLEKHKPQIEKAKESVQNFSGQELEDQADAEDMANKVVEIGALFEFISAGVEKRDKTLNQALQISNKFYDLCADVMASMKDIKDNIFSQEPPGIDEATIKEQQKELGDMNEQLKNARNSLEECRKIGDQLGAICGDTGKIEIQKQLEDLDTMAEDVCDAASERQEELNYTLDHAIKFHNILTSILTWLPMSKQKLDTMRAPSSDSAILKKQIEALKLFKMQTYPQVTHIDMLNQELASLTEMSPVGAERLVKSVNEINDQWNHLIQGITNQESQLTNTQVKVGELDHAMNDVIDALHHTEKELYGLDNVIGDPKCIETQMKKLLLIKDDIKSQENTCKKLNKTVDEVVVRTGDNDSSLSSKMTAMNELLRDVQVSTRDKENKLQDTLREVKKFIGEVDDTLHWIGELRMELKSKSPFGALPETACSQLETFIKRCDAVETKEVTVKSLLLNGQDMVDRCKPEDVLQLTEKLRKLKERWYETKNRALRRRDKMKEHLKNVEDFHSTLKDFTDWLNTTETSMRGFKYPSKIVEKVEIQIQHHKEFSQNVEAHAEKMQKLDRTGTYLKYFGRKQDTIYIKNLLVGIGLRWKKLLRRTDERGRLLQQAYCEDTRFYTAWLSLCSWLEDSEKLLNSFMHPPQQQAQTAKMKQEMEDLKTKNCSQDMEARINQLLRVKLFQHQLAAKHPSYYSTTRLGRNLKDRCTKVDEDRDILQNMLDDLKNKWNLVRSIISKSQNKLDEALLTSGRVSDALNSLQEWLSKAEAALSEDLPVLGDFDTVNLLTEQHKAVQQELLAREQTLEAVKTAGNVPAQHVQDITDLWTKVNMLYNSRENRLKEALLLAQEFQDDVTVMREFLPQAESELKFRPLPDDELAIIHLIERHEKFQEQMRNHQETVDKIKALAEEILRSCHPNAVRFVKYYLTITQTRWDQLLQRSKSRSHRLQEALKNIQGNAALLEELLAWLTDAHVLLATKEKDSIPDDIKVVDTLLKEHLEFHEDVTSRNTDVERLTKIVTSESKLSQARHYGSNWKLNDVEEQNPRVITLQNKWRLVWRISVDRKKKLQDALDTLLELENFKNFDFDLWRQRYLNWIQAKKFRITDFFRRQDKDCDGALTRNEFVEGMLISRFPSNKTELNAVFDIFDRSHTGKIDYKQFMDALKPDRHKSARMKSGKRKTTDSEMIHDEIERQISQCQCRQQFKAEKLEEGKYRFGENLKLKLVRFLNSCVMVRVGGGWVTLQEFLDTNDPCRARGRLYEHRESVILPDGTVQSKATFRSRTPDVFRGKKRQSDGYASSNSSAGSTGSTLRRSKVGMSMVNLSGSSSLYKHPDFGSTGSLNRSKRLSTSATSLSSKSPQVPKTTTPISSHQRPKTPSAMSSRYTPTPLRSRSTTPNPTKMSTPRRLPSTPKATTNHR